MAGSELLEKLAAKTIGKEELRRHVEDDFGLVPVLVSGLSSSKARIRYGCGSVLMDLSAAHPRELYPYFDSFVPFLDSRYRILTWNVLAILADLCAADVDKKFDALFSRYFGFLNDEYMVTVANVVGNSSRIALAKPYLIPKIVGEVLKVENVSVTPHLTEECKLVSAEHAIEAFDLYFDKMSSKEKAKVLSFAEKHLESSRKTLREKAGDFQKRRKTGK